MEASFETQLILKASVEGKTVGSVRAHEREGTCYIGRLIVHPDFQGRGIGTELMEEIERRFVDVERFELFTGHKSERNLQFYAKRGYGAFRSENVTGNLTLVFLEKGRGDQPVSGVV